MPIENLGGANTVAAAVQLGTSSTVGADAGTLTLSGAVNLNGGTLTATGAGNTTVTGVITGSSSARFLALSASISTSPPLRNLIAPASPSNPAWLGNQTPVVSAILTGAIDFPNISGNGFQDNTGTTYFNLPGNNNVEGRWVGDILIPGAGSTPVPITFRTGSDDGSTLSIDGNLVVNNNNVQGVTYVQDTVNLTPGLHAIDVEYYQGGGGASMDAQWDPTGGTNFVDIPNSALFIVPTNAVVKNGSGTLTLSNTNTYVGPTTINAGTLVATANGAMGPATAAGITVTAGGALGFAREASTTPRPSRPRSPAPARRQQRRPREPQRRQLRRSARHARRRCHHRLRRGTLTLTGGQPQRRDADGDGGRQHQRHRCHPGPARRFLGLPASISTSPPLRNLIAPASPATPPGSATRRPRYRPRSPGRSTSGTSRTTALPGQHRHDVLQPPRQQQQRRGPLGRRHLDSGRGSTPVPITFLTGSDDGSTLSIDGNLVVNNNNFQGRDVRSEIRSISRRACTPSTWNITRAAVAATMFAQWDPSGGSSFVDIPNFVLFTLPTNAVVKNGSGTLTLANTNNYIGTTTINAGTLVATADGAMGPATAAGITVTAGAALGFAGGVNYTMAEPTTLAGAGPAGSSGALENLQPLRPTPSQLYRSRSPRMPPSTPPWGASR